VARPSRAAVRCPSATVGPANLSGVGEVGLAVPGRYAVTENRQLKQRVRARMARTGETYSTARRHVLGQVRPGRRPAGLVKGYESNGGGPHRISALVARLLTQAGHVAPHTAAPYTDAMVCGLGGGIGFMYAIFEYQGLPPLITIVAQHHPEPWLPAVLGRLGVDAVEGHSTAPAPARAALREALDRDEAVWCVVDRSGLPWHAGADALPTDPYPVVVAGAKGDTVHVDDGGPAPHPVAEGDFVAAWSRHRKGRHHRVTLGRPGGPVDLPAAVRSALATTAAHMTGPVLGNNFDVNFGLSGLARFAEQLRDTRTRSGWSRRFAEPGAFAWALHRLHECLEVEYTAPDATRPLYADFLDEAAGVLGDAGPAEAAALFRESGRSWSRLADLAAETADSDPEVAALAHRRIAVAMSRGRAGADEIRALTAQIVAFEAPGPDPALLAELADLVEAAMSTEEEAVAILQRCGDHGG
jgi:hypothetical protein